MGSPLQSIGGTRCRSTRKTSGLPVAAHALKRIKPTAQQVGLSRNERVTNVQGAFRVSPEGKAAILGRRLVLVDDVLTSGSTVEGCTKALLRAGAANVDVLVFALGCRPGTNIHIRNAGFNGSL